MGLLRKNACPYNLDCEETARHQTEAASGILSTFLPTGYAA